MLDNSNDATYERKALLENFAKVLQRPCKYLPADMQEVHRVLAGPETELQAFCSAKNAEFKQNEDLFYSQEQTPAETTEQNREILKIMQNFNHDIENQEKTQRHITRCDHALEPTSGKTAPNAARAQREGDSVVGRGEESFSSARAKTEPGSPAHSSKSPNHHSP